MNSTTSGPILPRRAAHAAIACALLTLSTCRHQNTASPTIRSDAVLDFIWSGAGDDDLRSASSDAAILVSGVDLLGGDGPGSLSSTALARAQRIGLAARWAQLRAQALAARGHSWVLLPSELSPDRKNNEALLSACREGIAAAGLNSVLDARTLDLRGACIADTALRAGIAGILVNTVEDAKPLENRLGFASTVLTRKPKAPSKIAVSPRGADLARAAKMHLPHLRPTLTDGLATELRAVTRRIAQRSIVLVRDPLYRLPLSTRTRWIVHAQPGLERSHRALTTAFKSSNAPSGDDEPNSIWLVRSNAADRAQPKAGDVVVSFGARAPRTEFTTGTTLLSVAGVSKQDQSAAVAAILGHATIEGRLAYPMDSKSGADTGITIANDDAELRTATAEAKLMRPDFADDIKKFVAQAIETRIFPACQIAIALGDSIVLDKAYGHETYDDSSTAITRQHIFDLASVTKIATSTALAMHYHGRGKLRFEKPAHELVPAFAKNGDPRKRDITLYMLLTHSSGMAPWKRLWKIANTPSGVLRVAYDEALRFDPGSSYAYSDLGMILFGKCLESIGGAGLDVLAKQAIYDPLGMHTTRFGPIADDLDVVPTEDEPGRGGVIRGRVHDENAESIGGVAGHAGLFSTASDLLRFGRCIAGGGSYNGKRVFTRRSIDVFCTRDPKVLETSRAIGFDTPTDGNSAGRRLSKNSVGHTGFTGTSLWIDRSRDLVIVCLTNRIHPSRNEPRIHAFRRRLHDMVVAALRVDPVARRRSQ